MLTVHHLGVSQSERIVWLCEELEIPYELKRYDRVPPGRGMAPPEFKALHPAGSAPIITDGDVVLPESAAIMEYIIGKYGNGRLTVGPQAANYADYLYWFHFANGSFMPAQLTVTMLGMAGAAETPAGKMFAERLENIWRRIDARLAEAPYFAGEDFTAADIIMGFPLTTMRKFTGRPLGPYANLGAYLQRIGARPAYRRAMAKAEPGTEPTLD